MRELKSEKRRMSRTRSRGTEVDAAREVEEAKEEGVEGPTVRRARTLHDGSEMNSSRDSRQVDAEAEQVYRLAHPQRQEYPVKPTAQRGVAGEGAQPQRVQVAPERGVRLHLPIKYICRQVVHPIIRELARQRGAATDQRIVPQQEGLTRRGNETRPRSRCDAAPQSLQLQRVLLVENAVSGSLACKRDVLGVIRFDELHRSE
mmetsp:Transcript_1109/g.1953  ORF Transcript_1109/g.1953 Transcript_1109/m.1953 type:complete len:203 (-) Transcript_1109:16-624(-)